MRVVGNLFHLLSGGIVISLGWLLTAVVFSVLPVTRPLARAAFGFALLCLWPTGKEAVREGDIERFQRYVRTGALRPPGPAGHRPDPLRSVQIALWFPVGTLLAACHLLHAVILAIPVLGNPWASRNVSFLPVALWPLGWRILPQSSARASVCPGSAQLAARESWSSSVLTAIAAHLAGPAAKLAGVAIVLWASGSGDALFSPPAMADRIAPPAYQTSFGEWVRPATAPALPKALPVAQTPASPGCSVAAHSGPSSLRLSRGPTEYALPLGSRPLRASWRDAHSIPLSHIERLQGFASSKRHDKLRGPICRARVVARLEHSVSYASDVALARRLASKVALDVAIWQPATGVSALGRRRVVTSEVQAVAKIGAWYASFSHAKSHAVVAAESAQARVSRTDWLRETDRGSASEPGDA